MYLSWRVFYPNVPGFGDFERWFVDTLRRKMESENFKFDTIHETHFDSDWDTSHAA